MNELLDKLFKWDIKDLIKAIIGCFLFAFAVNIFLVPNSLYNGGILGIAQLIRSLFINVLTPELRIRKLIFIPQI